MEWDIQHLPEDNIIVVVNRGTATIEEVTRMNLELAEFSKQHTCHKHLIDFRLVRDMMTTLGIHNLPKDLIDIGYQLQTRVALIRSSDKVALSNFSFFENRCHNSSMPNIKIFTDYDDAYNWLLS